MSDMCDICGTLTHDIHVHECREEAIRNWNRVRRYEFKATCDFCGAKADEFGGEITKHREPCVYTELAKVKAERHEMYVKLHEAREKLRIKEADIRAIVLNARERTIRECEEKLRARSREWQAFADDPSHARPMRDTASDRARWDAHAADAIAALTGRDE